MPPKKRSTSRASSRSRSRSTSKPRANKMTPEELYFANVERRFTPDKDKWDGKYDFMGPIGVLFIMILSHVLIYYFYVCVNKYNATIIYPGHKALGGERMDKAFLGYLRENAIPSFKTWAIFLGFITFEYLCALTLPAFYVKGLHLASENGYRLSYKCNAVSAWYVVLVVVGLLHYTGVYPLYNLRRSYGEFLTVATIFSDAVAVFVYFAGLPRKIRQTPSLMYNFFMGSALNFRLPGNIDVKLFAECRNSWVVLMLLTLSCAAEQHHELGYITGNMYFMIFAHLLYVNAIQKGEECIISTWDIYFEKFGWMLAYWNTCGVPFLYCMQSMYIQTILKDKSHPTWVLIAMAIAYAIIYCVWDVINSQKNRFRMQRSGVPLELIRRNTFPQLPGRFIEHPRTLKSDKGELFVDGFYRYGRKIHYTVDVCMAFLWGASCGFDSFIPFFYLCFFIGHLIDRECRDEARCAKKYGKLWDQYVKLVPYRFIPGIY